MKMRLTPWSLRFPIRENSICTSLASRLAVGSSRIRILADREMARAMATICCMATEWWPRGRVTSISKPYPSMMAWACRFMAARSMRPKRRGSWPMKRLSATDMFGSRLTS
ncbi:hypothetical protein D3C86_1699140 [compost metagenome]